MRRRQQWPNVPILLMTGFADQRERAQDLATVIRDVVTKPFTLQQIREAVSEAVVDERGELADKAAGASAATLPRSRAVLRKFDDDAVGPAHGRTTPPLHSAAPRSLREDRRGWKRSMPG